MHTNEFTEGQEETVFDFDEEWAVSQAKWPEQQFGGDGPWNNYGDHPTEHREPIGPLPAPTLEPATDSPF